MANRTGAHINLQGVQMAISDADPLIKDSCVIDGKPCDDKFTFQSKAARFNSRGNICRECDSTAADNVSAARSLWMNGRKKTI